METTLTCHHCRHTWHPRTDLNPRRCTKCYRPVRPRPAFSCRCCGHEWKGVRNREPISCPQCRCTTWNRPEKPTYQCCRCGHNWQGRLETDPSMCPKCHTWHWNRLKAGQPIAYKKRIRSCHEWDPVKKAYGPTHHSLVVDGVCQACGARPRY